MISSTLTCCISTEACNAYCVCLIITVSPRLPAGDIPNTVELTLSFISRHWSSSHTTVPEAKVKALEGIGYRLTLETLFV